jgi:hypothetical protein
MMWSKLREKIRAMLCRELRGRIDFHVTAYRQSHDSAYGRAWISLDGQQVGSWSCFEQLLRSFPAEDLRARFPDGWFVQQYDQFASERGVYTQPEFKRILSEYLDADPQDALGAAIPLTRALAVIDRRIGRRTLARFSVDDEPDALVRLLWYLRTQKSQPTAAA